MGTTLESFVIVAGTVLLSGGLASRFARSYGRSPTIWFIIGSFLPIVGIGIVTWLGHRKS